MRNKPVSNINTLMAPPLIPVLSSCLEFLTWLPFNMDYELYDEINPFFPKLQVMMFNHINRNPKILIN